MSTTLASGQRAADDRLLARAQEVGQSEMARLLARTPESAELYQRATRTLPFGVVSSFQKMQPYPVYVTRGRGSHIWDQDGSEYLDFHCGFGAMVVGHAHPRVVEAIHEAAGGGTHFAATTEAAVRFGEEICRRFNLEMLRFTNSGTEATMDAIRVARAATGRDVICKIEGSYHGHHDSVMFSIVPNADTMGGRDRPASAPVSKGMVKDASKYIEVVPFNDAEHLERVFVEKGDRDRLPHHGARHDEHRHRRSPARLPAAGARAVHQAWRRLHLRRDQDRLHHRGRRGAPSGSGSSPIWCASPRRSRAGCRPRRSAGARISCA